MAQLKVKQISDFVTAVGGIHDATVGTAAVTAISTAKSDALSSAYSADVVAKSEAIASAVSQAEAKDVSRASTAVVNISTAKSEAIASAVSQAEAKDVSRASTAVVNISTAKSEAISAAYSADVTVLSDAKVYSDIQKGRIDALLLNSTEALDTFTEIERFITSLETSDVAGLSAALSTAVSNDAVHASAIALNTAKVGITTAQSNAIVANSAKVGITSEQSDAIVANSAKKGITEEQALAIEANSAKVGITTEQSTAIAANSAKVGITTAQSTAISTNSSNISALAGRVTTLEGLDVVQQVGAFVDARNFALDKSVSTSDNNITVFINGLQIHEFVEGVADGYTTANGKQFLLTGLGYNLEANDHVIVLGVLA